MSHTWHAYLMICTAVGLMSVTGVLVLCALIGVHHVLKEVFGFWAFVLKRPDQPATLTPFPADVAYLDGVSLTGRAPLRAVDSPTRRRVPDTGRIVADRTFPLDREPQLCAVVDIRRAAPGPVAAGARSLTQNHTGGGHGPSNAA